MDGNYDMTATAADNLAGLIRSENAGRVSGQPIGINYPGVPSVAQALAYLGIEAHATLSEEQWFRAADWVESY